MYHVYVLKSVRARKSYVGVTDDIKRRLKEHNSGKMRFTKRYKPWELLHSEEYQNLKEAGRREHYLKSGVGRRFLKKLFKDKI